MKFIIENKVFETLNNLCVAVIVAKGIDNTKKMMKFLLCLKKVFQMLKKNLKI